MELEKTTLENGVEKVSLSGRMDVDGSLKVDGAFNDIAKASKNVLVDMSDVSFLASLGIRTLITAAKTVSNNGGKLVLLSPQPNVERVLRESRIDTVLPIIEDSAAIDKVFVS
jgi:anti-sigma B factor antagonist